ncbi:MAG TPA: DUF885 domain-containing protein [Allosphingosinicella sp.]|jgi:uncharacterized protein (DUF885 family)|nr:DUF885 domain-containing protein [Allosphingosinicella sp.]
MPGSTFRLAALSLAALSVSAAAVAQPPAAAAPAATEAERLKRLFHESDEANLRRNPVGAIFRGDLRYADRLGDFITDEYFKAERAAGEADLAALRAIDRSKLSATDRIAYDVFEWQTRDSLRNLEPEMLALGVVRPINHMSGFHTFYPTFASGEGAAPFKTVADYENNLKRHKDYVVFHDRAIGRFRQGMASGVLESRLTIGNVVDQLDLLIAQNVEESPFYAPIRNFPTDFSEADKARLTAAYRASIEREIQPAHRRIRDFLRSEYLPRAREGVGLVHMKGGAKVYRRLIESNTTLPLTAGEVHEIGLREVARIKGEMEGIKTRTGFKGSLAQFFEYLRTDPKFAPATKEVLRQGYEGIARRVDARIAEQFSTLPRSPLEIRPVEPFREKTEAGGSYQQGTPDGSRPGIFYYNGYDLPSRRLWGMETLYLHEGSPGHHFQISLAQENEALPAFMRFGGNTAYVEGWALYAETLWDELGLETDPYQRFGGLNDEMLRAMRLVVDTGIHSKGWSRDRGIAYMLANSGMSRTEVVAEVERYIAIPGQALAYKIGALTIQRLRAKAEAALGSRFDPRAFHAQVLMTGALPMAVLEKKIDDWIAATRPKI